jgi:hypothetical protein
MSSPLRAPAGAAAAPISTRADGLDACCQPLRAVARPGSALGWLSTSFTISRRLTHRYDEGKQDDDEQLLRRLDERGVLFVLRS